MAKSSTKPEHTVTQTLRLPASLNEALKQIAAEERRSLNSEVLRVLEAHVAVRERANRILGEDAA